MTKIKSISLKNYCGYRDTKFNFCDSKGKIKNLIILFGPNGFGKSNLLNAISLTGLASQHQGRDIGNLFRKITYNPDYDQAITAYRQEKGLEVANEMEVAATWVMNNKDKSVIINNKKGVVKNELPRDFDGYSYYIDADHPNNASRFQFPDSELTPVFLDMAKIVYGFDCYFDVGKNNEKVVVDGGIKFYTDFVIVKWGDKIHFRNMSDGENKIAKMLESLCDDYHMGKQDTVLIDSFDKELYYLRHAKMIDKMISTFPNKQFVITTHSGTLIEHAKKKYGKGCLYDLEIYKEKELNSIK